MKKSLMENFIFFAVKNPKLVYNDKTSFSLHTWKDGAGIFEPFQTFVMELFSAGS